LTRAALWGPVLLYCVLVFALSSIPDLPALPGGMGDKTAHVLLYGGLGLLAGRALSGGIGRPVTWRVTLLVLGFCALYGLSDEIHQLFVPHREFDLKDLAADVAGGGSGVVVLWLWSMIRRFSHAI
jgi:VanZ family protein